jgi:hypothetical protein
MKSAFAENVCICLRHTKSPRGENRVSSLVHAPVGADSSILIDSSRNNDSDCDGR